MPRNALLAVLIAFSLLLAGCGSSSSNTPTATSAPPPASGSSGGSTGGSGGSTGGSGGTGGGSSQSPVAFTYVGTSLGQNSSGIYGFAVAADGSATSVPGSPATGASNDIVTNSAFVFGDDSHNIATYARAADGSIKQTSSFFAVGNNGPGQLWQLTDMSLDHTGQTLYAVENAGADDLFYFFFHVASNGSLSTIGQIGPNTNYVSPLVFSPDNNFAYGFGCFHIGWEVTGFHRNGDGSLTPIPGTNPAAPQYAGPNQDYCPTGEAVSQMGYLAVADTALQTNTIGLGAYKINSDGSLTFIQSSTLQTALALNTGCCSALAMGFDRSGQFLAIANQTGIQMFQLNSSGTFTALGGVQQPGPNYMGVQWDADNHLYATSGSGLHVFTFAQGVLTPASGSPHPAGAAGSLTVLPTH